MNQHRQAFVARLTHLSSALPFRSRTFQRFAVWGNSKLKDVAKEGKVKTEVLDERVEHLRKAAQDQSGKVGVRRMNESFIL